MKIIKEDIINKQLKEEMEPYTVPVRAFVWFQTFEDIKPIQLKMLIKNGLSDIIKVREVTVHDFEPELPISDYEIGIKGIAELLEENNSTMKKNIEDKLIQIVKDNFSDAEEIKTDVRLS